MSTEKSVEEQRMLERENMMMLDWVCKSTSMEGQVQQQQVEEEEEERAVAPIQSFPRLY